MLQRPLLIVVAGLLTTAASFYITTLVLDRNTGPAAPPDSLWTQSGTGDCGGGDWNNSTGARPTESLCTSDRARQIAICWDGVNLQNKSERTNEAWCTYKSINISSCNFGGAGSPGLIYVCSAKE